MNGAKSIFRRSAEGGITLGVIFVCIFLLETVSGSITWLLALGLMIYVPIFVYRRLSATYRKENGLTTFSGLWFEGIMLFACGSIILGLGTLIFMKWLVPGYLPTVVEQMSVVMKSHPQLIDSSVSSQQLQAYMASIRPIDISMTMLWAAAFTGSIASLIIAAIVKSKHVPPASSSHQ